MSVLPYYYSYPRTTNQGYGAFTSREPPTGNYDAVHRQLHNIYSGWEARLGVTANSEYGAFSRKFPVNSNCSRAALYHVNSDYLGHGFPNQKTIGAADKRAWCSPVLTNKLTQQPENQQTVESSSITLPPISFRGGLTKPASPQFATSFSTNAIEDDRISQSRQQRFCRPFQQPIPLTDRTHYRDKKQPLPPRPVGRQPPRYNIGTGRWEAPPYQYHNQPAGLRSQSPPPTAGDSPRLFPPLLRSVPLPPRVGHEECDKPRESVLHYGTELIPFSDVEAVELHMKNRDKLMLSVDELRKRYIS